LSTFLFTFVSQIFLKIKNNFQPFLKRVIPKNVLTYTILEKFVQNKQKYSFNFSV